MFPRKKVTNEYKTKGNGLFNDVLNTFYLRLYDVGHTVEDYTDKEETRYRHAIDYLFLLAARCFYMDHQTDVHQVRSGQVRVFNVHIQNKTVVAHACHVLAVRPESVAGGWVV